MAKKSGIGRGSDDFDFSKTNPKPPPKLSQIRQSDRASFYLRPEKNIFPKDPCGDIGVGDIPNLDIIGKPGREFGETVLYDPVQRQNYLSQADRYERSLDLLPSNIVSKDGKTIYYFCSGLSPTGFWEVTVGGGGTFLRFGTPILTIICPRPLRLQDLTTIETDGTSIKWTQTQGRLTIVSPSSGDGSLDPSIFIIGNRTPLDPPILLLAELEDNPSIFDFLLINTTIREIIDGVSGSEAIAPPNAGPSYQIPCFVSPVPTTSPNTAFCWDSNTTDITWDRPSDYLWVTEYQLQRNFDGVYTTIQTIPATAERRATVALGAYYRILAINNVLGGGYAATESCRFFFPATPPYYVFATDRIDGLSGSEQAIATQYPLTVTRLPPETDIQDGQSGSDGQFLATQYPLAVQIVPASTDILDGQSGSDGQFLATIYNLTGGIVG